MSLAFLCPGQGSQKVGMGHDLYHETKVGKSYFQIANEVLDQNIEDIIFNGPEDLLKQTQYTQPAIYIISVIIGELLKNNGVKPQCTAGHSLGEYSALALAGAFDFKTGLELVKVRALGMQSAGKHHHGTMAAVIGLEDLKVQELCLNHTDGIVVAANFNAFGQVVISGHVDAVKAVMPKLKEAGAIKVVELNVSGAFHSPLMSSAKDKLIEKLESIDIKNCDIPVYANTSAAPIFRKNDVRSCLINQLENPVRWHESISRMVNDGVTNAIEVGPGRVLQGLSKRIDRSLNMNSVESHEQIVNFNYV